MFPLIGPFFSIISAFLAFFRKWRRKLKIPPADFQTLEAGIESLPQTSLWHTRNTYRQKPVAKKAAFQQRGHMLANNLQASQKGRQTCALTAERAAPVRQGMN